MKQSLRLACALLIGYTAALIPLRSADLWYVVPFCLSMLLVYLAWALRGMVGWRAYWPTVARFSGGGLVVSMLVVAVGRGMWTDALIVPSSILAVGASTQLLTMWLGTPRDPFIVPVLWRAGRDGTVARALAFGLSVTTGLIPLLLAASTPLLPIGAVFVGSMVLARLSMVALWHV